MITVQRRLRETTRREFLGASAALVSGAHLIGSRSLAATPACVLASEQEEGPYYVDYEKIRRDVTEGRPGVPVRLRVRLMHAKECSPLANAALDIWHCDAQGVYSGFTASSPDGPPGGRGRRPGAFDPPEGMPPGPRPGAWQGMRGPRSHGALDETRFLRGVQLTNAEGIAEFATVYPGWYAGRAIHIHCKVHIGGDGNERYSGGHVAHTGQFFFPEEITERVAKLEPYAKRLQIHRTTQDEDHVFEEEHGSSSMLILSRLDKGDEAAGFLAEITVGINPDALPAPVGMHGGPPPFSR
jgi:protocatechuate 3,4-dioxygenase beta subunit